MKTFHLESFNRGKWVSDFLCFGHYEPTVRLSTIVLPIEIDGCQYETCLFEGRDSEVLARYATLDEAVRGHEQYRREHRLQ